MKQTSNFNSDLSKLKSILATCHYSGDRDTLIIIEELDQKASLKKITIDRQNGNWICFMPDKILNGKKCKKCQISGISPLLKNDKACSHHRMCDAIIFELKNGRLCVTFIELKSSTGGHEGQFRSARQFIKYLMGLLFEFNDISSFKEDEREERFMLFYLKPPIHKTSTTRKDLKSSGCGSTPHNPRKIPVTNGRKLPI